MTREAVLTIQRPAHATALPLTCALCAIGLSSACSGTAPRLQHGPTAPPDGAPAHEDAGQSSETSCAVRVGFHNEAPDDAGGTTMAWTTHASEPELLATGGVAEVDIGAWLEARGIDRSKAFADKLEGCRETRVGPAPSDALVCLGYPSMPGSEPTGETLFSLRILAITPRGELTAVLTVPGATGPMDPPMMPRKLAGAYLVALETRIEPGGSRLELKDTPGVGCEDAKQRIRGHAAYDRLVRRVCAQRGRYVWRNGMFVREGK